MLKVLSICLNGLHPRRIDVHRMHEAGIVHLENTHGTKKYTVILTVDSQLINRLILVLQRPCLNWSSVTLSDFEHRPLAVAVTFGDANSYLDLIHRDMLFCHVKFRSYGLRFTTVTKDLYEKTLTKECCSSFSPREKAYRDIHWF